MNKSIESFLSCYVFTDKGVELFMTQEIPFMLESELQTIGNYYSIIFGNLKFDQGLLFGPLPVAYHHDKLVFIYGNTIKDKTIKDSRVIRDGYLTPFFILIFFPVRLDNLFSRCRVSIREKASEWLSNNRDIKHITQKSLNSLNMQFLNIIMREGDQMGRIEEPRMLDTTLTKNIEFLNTIGNSLGRSLRIGLFGSTKQVISTLQRSISQIFPSLCGMNISEDKKAIVYRFSNLFIEVNELQEELLDFKQNPALRNVKWRDLPKDFDGILLAVRIPSNYDILSKNLQIILQKTPNLCPITIVVRYLSGYPGNISETPISTAISDALDRTFSLVESKEGQNAAETALIEIFEKIVIFLSN